MAKRKTKSGKRLQKYYPGGFELTEKQKEAVRLLCIESMKVQDAAAALGVHRCTIWRWSKERGFSKEWDRQLKAYIRKWREEQGYNRRRAEHRARLRQLEKKMNDEAAKITRGPTRAFNRAWQEYVDCLLESERMIFGRLKSGL